MASQVLSGSSNPSYTNNTGQNVRILINYMSGCTSMTWAGVTVTGSSAVVSKDTLEILGEFRSAVFGQEISSGTYLAELSPTKGSLLQIAEFRGSTSQLGVIPNATNFTLTDNGALSRETLWGSGNLFYVPTSIRPGGTFPTEVILANGQSYSAVCSAYNIVVIGEDGN